MAGLELAGPDIVNHGLTTCQGCGMEIVARAMMRVLGKKTIVLTPPSCSAILTGYGVETGWQVPAFQSNLENIAAYCAGIRAGLEVQGLGEDVTIVAFAGDGGTVDIGLQSLSAAIERGHRFLYVCYDNEAYMNTGIQRSGATPLGAWTTTTPGGKPEVKKDIVAMLRAQGIPYIATASAGYIEDFEKKVARAREIDGPAYIHVHSPCPPGWRFAPENTLDVARLAVRSGAWVLYEVDHGRLRITRKIRKFVPLEEYLEAQGRFRRITEEQMEALRKQVMEIYAALEAEEGAYGQQ